MPQMKPMNWILLFILTNMLMMMMNIMIFFMKKNKNIMNLKKMKKNYMNWKW